MSNFRDQLTVSAATTKTLTFQDDGIHKPFMTNLTVKSGIANAAYADQTCLFLDQPTNYIDGALHSYEQKVVVPNSMLAKGTEGVSFFARVKWLGRSRPKVGAQYPYDYNITIFDNGNNWVNRGWSFAFNSYGGVAGNSWLSVAVQGSQATANLNNIVTDAAQWTAGKFMGSYCDIYASYEWVDVGMTLRYAPDEERTYVTLFKCASSNHDIAIGRSFVNKALVAPTDSGSLFGTTPGIEHVDGQTTSGNFRGAVSEARLWNRCLSEDEMRAVFAGQQQGWTVGVPNGSADEFSDDECVAGFAPRTMPWSRMRKTLTSANPTLSLTATFPADRRNLPRVLHLKPILSAEAVGAKLDVHLNGTRIGRVTLRDGDRWFFVKESVFSRLVGADGTATFTLTRTGNMAGTVMFDFLELTGSFQLGGINGSYTDEFTWNGVRTIHAAAEDTTPCAANLDPQKTLTVYFPLKQAVVSHYRFRLSTRLFWQTEATLPLTFALNGVAVTPTEEVAPARTFHFDIEPGGLQEMNQFTITSGESTVTGSGNKSYGIDYYRLEAINTDPAGMVISFY